ncbi:MAG: Gfo/Idh/MocA family oxidoreductase [Clostridium sp.]|nr:Gfo/Idh/MocA family oxidoreductase [Clostridium sp.]
MKIGIVGSGMIVRYVLDHVWSKIDNIEAAAIWCRSEEREIAKSIAKDFRIENVYEDYDAFLKDDSFDFVYIGLVNSLHYEYSMKAIQAGKSVVCEKPFTSTAKQAEDLLEAAKSKQVFLFESILPWYSDNYEAIKNQLPEIGDLKLIQCNFSQYSRRYASYLEGKVLPVFNPMLDGGALYDISVYSVHWVMGLVGVPQKTAYYPNLGYNGIDTSGTLVMDYGSFKAICSAAKDSASPGRCMVQGDQGYILMDSHPGECHKIELVKNGEEAKPLDKKPLGEPFIDVYEKIIPIVEAGNYGECCRFMDRVIEVMRVMEDARKAAGIKFSCD